MGGQTHYSYFLKDSELPLEFPNTTSGRVFTKLYPLKLGLVALLTMGIHIIFYYFTGLFQGAPPIYVV